MLRIENFEKDINTGAKDEQFNYLIRAYLDSKESENNPIDFS